jgi:hypothetical protein
MSEISIIEPPPGAPASAVSWPAIFAGAVVAMAITLIFVALGAGFGAGSFAAWPNLGHGLTTFTAMAGVWLVITQWVSSGIGGYVTGRLRTRWHGVHTHEVFFRDTANGLIAWALATIVVAGLGVVVAAMTTPDVAASAQAAAAASSDAARKAAAGFSVFTAISMLVGAFIACVAAALGGLQRDEHP